MKKLLCLLLTLLLIHPALAEDALDALDAPDVASQLSCADGALLAVSPDLRVLRRDTAGDWALILSAEQISAACPPRFMPDAANALLLPGENGAYALLLLPDTSGQIAVLSLTGATCVLTRVFADFLPTDSEMTAQWALLSAARAGNTLYAAFSSNFATYSTYALSLADGSSFLLSDAPIRFLMPLADGQLLACVNPPISSIDESCFALLDADSGESSRLCALPAHKAYAGFALDGDSLYFTDGETIYCAAPPYDAVESVGYLPSLDTSARLPALMVDNCYCVCNAELGFFAAQLHTAPRCTLRVDARLSNVNRALVSQYLRAHPDVAVVYAPHNASTAPEYRQHMESGDALDIYAFTLPNESFIPLRDKGDLLDLRPLMGADTPDSLLPQVLAPLEKAGGVIRLDMTLAGEMEYYNGLVFQGYLKALPRPLLKGGRYDLLMQKFTPGAGAIGFAVYLDELDRLSAPLPPVQKNSTDRVMLNVALPKGRLGDKVYNLLAGIGYGCPEDYNATRKLVVENPEAGIRYFLVKPSDVAIYVEHGAADVGIVGKDILTEASADVYELLDTGLGKCRMCVAAPADYKDDPSRPVRVATKFVNIAKSYYASMGRDIDIIKLNGSIELAPILGLSDVIVDIVETGTTLRENGLKVVTEFMPISARFIANKASYQFKHAEMDTMLEKLRAELQNKEEAK